MVMSKAELTFYKVVIVYLIVFFAILYYVFCHLFPRIYGPDSWTRWYGRNDNISTCELGSKRKLTEMLPIIVFKESFHVQETQCSVCLSEYLAEDKLKRIPICGHIFHMGCIDHWLATETTCPLCRLSLLTSGTSNQTPNNDAAETTGLDTHDHSEGPPHGDPNQVQQISNPSDLEESHTETSILVQVDSL